MLCDFVTALEESRNQEFFSVGITQDDARAIRGRDDAKTVALLLVAHRGILPELGGGLFGSFEAGAADGEIGIVGGAASSGAGGAVSTQATEAARAGNTAKGKDGAVVAIGGEFLVVAVGDGACGIDEARAQDGADDIHFCGSAEADAIGQTDGKGKARGVRSGEQHAAFGYE